MMKLLKSMFVAVVVSSMVVSPAWADRYGHHGGGHGGGRGGWGPGLLFGTALYLATTAPRPAYYPPPVTYSPPIYTQPIYVQQAPVIVQNTLPPPHSASTAGQDWWYYCGNPVGYYPYVQACPSGWTRVSPTPPGQ